MKKVVNSNLLQMKHPFTMIISGPTMSGKTMFLRRLLKHHQKLIDIPKKIIKVLWVHGQDQSLHSLPIPSVDVGYTKEMPDEEMLEEFAPDIIIFDDMMAELGNSVELSNMFTKGAHHKDISVIFIIQNLFHKGTVMRTLNVNTHYIVLMKNPRDKLQVYNLGKQMYPSKVKNFVQLFDDVTEDAFGYLYIDLKNNTPNELRLRSKITPEDREDKSFNQDVYVLN